MSSHASFLSNLRVVIVTLLLFAVILLIPACARRTRRQTSAAGAQAKDQSVVKRVELNPRINVNTASASELETLPGIGRALAERIIEHREKFGPFRRPEHLIIVRGISDKRFRALRDLITVE